MINAFRKLKTPWANRGFTDQPAASGQLSIKRVRFNFIALSPNHLPRLLGLAIGGAIETEQSDD
jgi:hypothetical protein